MFWVNTLVLACHLDVPSSYCRLYWHYRADRGRRDCLPIDTSMLAIWSILIWHWVAFGFSQAQQGHTTFGITPWFIIWDGGWLIFGGTGLEKLSKYYILSLPRLSSHIHLICTCMGKQSEAVCQNVIKLLLDKKIPPCTVDLIGFCTQVFVYLLFPWILLLTDRAYWIYYGTNMHRFCFGSMYFNKLVMWFSLLNCW